VRTLKYVLCAATTGERRVSMSLSDVKSELTAVIAGILLVIIGAVTGDVAYAIGNFIINALGTNQSRATTLGATQQLAALLPPVFSILGITLIVIAAVLIIKKLAGVPREVTG